MSIVTRIPNLLGANALANAQSRLLDPSVHWYYLNVTASVHDLERLPEYAGSMSHTIFNHEKGPISPLWETAFGILLAALDQQGQTLQSVYRVRLGMNTRTPYTVTHSPHIDQAHRHRVGLFYAHTTDGDTTVYHERAVYGDPELPSEYSAAETITPEENLWVDFDGEHFHSSSTPTAHETRVVLTVNYSIL